MEKYSEAWHQPCLARIEQYRDYLRRIRIEDPVWLFHIAAWPPER